jgi:adenine-specific DNA-methyltransferase
LGEDRKWLRAPLKKIVSSYFGQSGSFAYDEKGDHVVVQGYGWIPHWRLSKKLGMNNDDMCKAYLTIFNSHFFTELLSETCPAVGGGQLNLSKRYSEKVKLPDLIARVENSAELDIVVRDLSFIGEKIMREGLARSPRARAEELVRLLYGV